jgi:hypothetical protein
MSWPIPMTAPIYFEGCMGLKILVNGLVVEILSTPVAESFSEGTIALADSAEFAFRVSALSRKLVIVAYTPGFRY